VRCAARRSTHDIFSSKDGTRTGAATGGALAQPETISAIASPDTRIRIPAR
jgi:hypothetical protein